MNPITISKAANFYDLRIINLPDASNKAILAGKIAANTNIRIEVPITAKKSSLNQ